MVNTFRIKNFQGSLLLFVEKNKVIRLNIDFTFSGY